MAPALSPKVGDRLAFLAAAREQGKCAVTGKTGQPWHPHHVVYEKHLAGFLAPIYDARNVLRVIEKAHANHHSAARRIRTVELRDENINYALYLMGVWRTLLYLRRYYDDYTEPDLRLASIEAEQIESEADA